MYDDLELFHRIAVLIPVHFRPEEDPQLIRDILDNTFRHQELFSPRENTLAVVDRDTVAEEILRGAESNESFYGTRILTLQKNRCKAGAVREGLELLLENETLEFFITRDCDGDHFIEDIPRMVSLLEHASRITDNTNLCVMGARASLDKPMGYVRREWELLTNDILTGMLKCRMGRDGRVMDERLWNGLPPDIQSGYRAYSRDAAIKAVECLKRLPEDRTILKFACEFEPFVDINLNGGVFGQINRLTLVEQPVSSFADSDFSLEYASYLKYLAERLSMTAESSLVLFDNALSRCSLYFTDHRDELHRCREIIAGRSIPPPIQPPFV